MNARPWLTTRPIVQAISSVAQYRLDGDYFDRLYLAMRWLPVLRPNDWALLPDDFDLREYVRFLEQTLWDGVRLQVIWVPNHDYLLDESIYRSAAVMAQLRELVREGAVFLPYAAVTPEFRKWFDELISAECVGETVQWGKQWANKGWLHRWVSTPDMPSPAESVGLPLLPGYNATNTHELLEAWQWLQDRGITSVGIKPLASAFGNGIVSLNGKTSDQIEHTLKHYRFPHGPVMLEQWVRIDQDGFGERSWSTHFIGNELFAPACRQIVMHGTSNGNITPGFDEHVSSLLEDITRRAVALLQPHGIGGFNGPIVNDIPYLLDPNVGRSTGVCSSLAFRVQYCPAQAVTMNMKLGKINLTIWEVWNRLVANGLAFDLSTGMGAFPQGVIPCGWSQMIVSATTERETLSLMAQVKKVLEE